MRCQACVSQCVQHAELTRFLVLAQKDVLHQAHLKLRAHASSASTEQSKLQGRLHSTRMEWAAASQANQHMVDDLQKLRMQLVRRPPPLQLWPVLTLPSSLLAQLWHPSGGYPP